MTRTIVLEGLSKRFGRTIALDGLDLTLAAARSRVAAGDQCIAAVTARRSNVPSRL